VRRLVLVLLVGLSACGFFGNHTKRYAPPGIQAIGQPVSGKEWFQRDCAFCHGNAGAGTLRAPDIVTGHGGAALTDFMLRTGRMPIADPRDQIKERAPAYSPDVIAKIVDYVDSLEPQGPPVPAVDAAAGTLADGEELFQANCAACHSASAVGGTLTQAGSAFVRSNAGNQVPGLLKIGPLEIAEAMRAGPGTMPVFGDQTFSDAQVDSIVAYILFLQKNSVNRGGAALGRYGPVAEGAVAWIVGIGLLLLLARWIGRTVRQHG